MRTSPSLTHSTTINCNRCSRSSVPHCLIIYPKAQVQFGALPYSKALSSPWLPTTLSDQLLRPPFPNILQWFPPHLFLWFPTSLLSLLRIRTTFLLPPLPVRILRPPFQMLCPFLKVFLTPNPSSPPNKHTQIQSHPLWNPCRTWHFFEDAIHHPVHELLVNLA